MTMRKMLPLLLFSALLLIGCDSSDSDSLSETAATLIPLEAGNNWSFQRGDGLEGQVDIEIRGNSTIDGTSYRIAEANITGIVGSMAAFTFAIQELDNGLYIGRVDGRDERDVPLLGFELRTEVSEGDTYSHVDEEGNVFNVIVSEQRITVPAGTFDVRVYTVTQRSNGGTDTAFIAPGVGPVQLDYDGVLLRLVSTNVE